MNGTSRVPSPTTPDYSVRSHRRPAGPMANQMCSNASVDMGWGRLLFGQTFREAGRLARMLCEEEAGTRDIAVYLRDPHVLLAQAPSELFLDPSHIFRLPDHSYRPSMGAAAVAVRRAHTAADAEAVNRIYQARGMVTFDPEFLVDRRATKLLTFFVAESLYDGRVIGTVTGVDHVEAFRDPERGSSLWCLAVDPQTAIPGVGEMLIRQLVEHYFARGRRYVDLSVMHDNEPAIQLYEKLGFRRVPAFTVKHKNPFNEPLFVPTEADAEVNVYTQIIVDEARRRGIHVELLDPAFGHFRLTLGGRSVASRESLSELTSAVAFTRCDDKRMTHAVLSRAKLRVPAQAEATDATAAERFLARYGRVVVKPARGEQGAGVSVDVTTEADLHEAIAAAHARCPDVIVEELVEGEDVRFIVIDHKVVAVAVRRPARVTGTGRHTIRELIEEYNRRRLTATQGESAVPLDAETERCVRSAGHTMDHVLAAGATIAVRKTANLHTGGTIHDVTDRVAPPLREAAVEASVALDIPVVGLDLAVPDFRGSAYAIIEANERPGLANHEPQPTAERFVDLLFPQTAVPRPAPVEVP